METGNTEQVDSLTEHSKWGGKRPGAGRRHGSENVKTKERKVAEAEMRARIIRSTEALLNAQMALAKGETNLYHVHETGEGKNRKRQVDMVTDQDTIVAYLAGELDDDGDYYYISTKSPDTRSIDSLLDRTYGKAKQSMDITSDDKPLQPATVIDLGVLNADKPETE